jgi:NadR type nicotinamide-nucleotide adenylyltransferase
MEKEKIIKIALLGPESTGKSTLAEQLANVFETTFVPEYARHFFNQHNINNYGLDDLETIYQHQLFEEDKFLERANSVFFADTTLLSGKIWAMEVFKELPLLLKNEDLINRYHFYLLCDIDLTWEEDGQRKNAYNRLHLFQRHEEELKAMKASYAIISGIGEERLNNAVKAVKNFLKTIAQSDV